MYYVYILKSKKTNKLYIGQTNDLKRRFVAHNNGLSPSTKYGVPWELIYYEAYKTRLDAINRERKLKRFKNSYAHLKNRIKTSLA